MAFEPIVYKPGDTLNAEHLNEMQTAIVNLSNGVGGNDAHANSTSNPHKVTKEQVGLGNVDNTADANKNVASAKKVANQLVVKLNSGATEGYNQCTFDGSSKKSFNITPAKIGAEPAIEDTSNPGCYYRMVDGEQEWLNPPLEYDTAYRTTERFRGNPVYTKLIYCGMVDNTSTLTKYLGGDISNVIRVEGFTAINSEQVKTIPQFYRDTDGHIVVCTSMCVSGNQINTATTLSNTKFQVFARIWYVKKGIGTT
jgi:hypothetical protein